MGSTELVSAYQLPYDAAFVHKDCSEHKHRIANDNLALLMQSGSGLFGTAVDAPDEDLYGICVEPQRVMLGSHTFTEYHYRSAPAGQCSTPTDIDLNVYGLSKWTEQVCKGNPNHLLMLFAPTDKLRYVNWPGQEIRDNAAMFLAREHADRFLGYLEQQRKDIMGNQRPELVRKYGYDTKSAYHAIRIAMQGNQLLRSGEIFLPMIEDQRRYLLAVRKGLLSLETVLSRLGREQAALHYARQHTTKLPERVDMDRVDEWLASVYLRWWG